MFTFVRSVSYDDTKNVFTWLPNVFKVHISISSGIKKLLNFAKSLYANNSYNSTLPVVNILSHEDNFNRIIFFNMILPTKMF